MDGVMKQSWKSNFFYQLYSLMYLIGNGSEECGLGLKQMMEIVTIMHSKGKNGRVG